MHQNRETVFSDAIGAGDSTVLLDIPWDASYSDMLALFDHGKTDKGVWCGGTASMLNRKNIETGLEQSFLYFYGIPGFTTHVLNVVIVNSTWHLQDAYFNEYHDDFLELLSTAAAGKATTNQIGSTHSRRAVWTQTIAEPPTWTTNMSPVLCKGVVEYKSSDYAAYKMKTEPKAWMDLASTFSARGLPHAFDSFICFPFAISGDEGYVTDPKSTAYSGMLGRIHEVLGIST
ncbi:MAG: hypothetical protein J0H89_03325 [Rhizobiales bacterium]|nr:hypothetical protein [Hyphomicrobiales bacterium]